MPSTESRAFLNAAKNARAVRVSGLSAPFAAMENALADLVSEQFALMRQWRAMEIAETDQSVKGTLEEYKQTLGALERETTKALEHVQQAKFKVSS